MTKSLGIIFIALSFLIPAYPAIAEIEPSSPFLCSVINVAEYSLEEGLFEGTAESFDLPQFVRIDLKNKTISEVGENVRNRSSQIKTLQYTEESVIMQGIENDRSWSMIIEEKTGKMSASISEERIGFIIFGACTSL